MTCPLCKEPILDNQSRVCIFIPASVADKHKNDCAYAHRKCAAAKWPDVFKDRPPPSRP